MKTVPKSDSKDPPKRRGRKSDKSGVSLQKRQEIIKRLETEKGSDIEFKSKSKLSGGKGGVKRKQIHSKSIMNLKQMITAENNKYNHIVGSYGSIEAGISVKPSKRYCEFTGFHARFTDKKTGLR